MPLYSKRNLGEDTFLAVWKISEPASQLHTMLGDAFHDTHARVESLHWLASRVLVRELFPTQNIRIAKDSFNKPSLAVDGAAYFISITHSHGYAAVLVSKSMPVGLDMEQYDERIHRVKHKFTRDDEFAYLNGEHEERMLTIIWSAKEALYKYYGKKELDFKKHLQVLPFVYPPLGPVTGSIHKGDFQIELKISIEELDDYVLTWIG